MKKYNCPKCGKELVNLTENDNINTFWCDDCNTEIIIENEKGEDHFVSELKMMEMAYKKIRGMKRMYRSECIEYIEYLQYCMGYIRALRDAELIVHPQYDALSDYVIDGIE